MRRKNPKIVVDLTPVLPGGTNGGAKIFTLQLIKKLAEIAQNYHFTLLATEKNYIELEKLSSHNINIVQATSFIDSINQKSLTQSFKHYALHNIKPIVPRFIRKIIKYFLNSLRSYIRDKLLSKKIPADLVFYPFTAPFSYGLNAPIVSIIYDLQAIHYPFFFSEEDQSNREKNFNDACKKAERLVCISDFVRGTVIQESNIPPEKIKTVHISLAHRLREISQPTIFSTLKQLKLEKQNFLLFPANFWTHKNHKMLITAFGIYRQRHPESTLKLVCTGADCANKQQLLKDIKDMGLSQLITLPGYLSDDELSALLHSCKALIYPSLYEGFGMPIVEAMAAGIPVLCSNTTSLPEIAGSAAILFNPKKPTEIANAIERLETEPGLIESLSNLGKLQAEKFCDEEIMAKQYLEIFSDVIKRKKDCFVQPNAGAH